MKRTERVGALIRILTESPNKIYSLQYFCDLFDAAKFSISEDIQSASQAIELTGSGLSGNDPRLQGRGTFRAGYLAGSSRRAAGGLRAAAVRLHPACSAAIFSIPRTFFTIRIWSCALHGYSPKSFKTAALTVSRPSRPRAFRWRLRSHSTPGYPAGRHPPRGEDFGGLDGQHQLFQRFL